MPTVAAITPADGAVAVRGDTPAVVRLTRLDSNDYTKVETTQADFADGTLTDVAAEPDDTLILAPAYGVLLVDFASDAIGSPPSGWSFMWGGSTGSTVESIDAQHALRTIAPDGADQLLTYDTVGTAADRDVTVDLRAGNIVTAFGLALRAASGGDGYLADFNADQTVCLHRKIGGGYTNLTSTGFTWSADTWYTLRFQVLGTTIRAKFWLRGDAEPSTWTLETTDGTFASGAFGVFYAYSGITHWFDNVRIAGEGPVSGYAVSGSRVSPAYPLSAVGKFGTGRVEYDATLPAGTNLTFKISPNASAWTTVASGDPIAFWAEGDDLAAADIYVKAELATSDSAATPVLSEVRLIFEPQDPALVEVDIDGIAHTIANGLLAIAGKTAKVTAGPVIVDPCGQDMTYATRGSWFTIGKQVTVLVKYAGTTISTTTFTTEAVEQQGGSGLYAWWLSSALGGVYDGPLSADAWYFVSHLEDYLFRGDAHWYVQFGPSTTCDAYYWIAHAFRCDTQASALVGQPVAHDVPAAGVGECWARSDTNSSSVLQSFLRNDHAAAAAVAVEMQPHDEALAAIVALPLAADEAAAGAVYEVNRNNAIDLRVISVEEAALLDALGLLRQ